MITHHTLPFPADVGSQTAFALEELAGRIRLQIPIPFWPLKILSGYVWVYNRTVDGPNRGLLCREHPKKPSHNPLNLYLHEEGVPHVLAESQQYLWVVCSSGKGATSTHLFSIYSQLPSYGYIHSNFSVAALWSLTAEVDLSSRGDDHP